MVRVGVGGVTSSCFHLAEMAQRRLLLDHDELPRGAPGSGVAGAVDVGVAQGLVAPPRLERRERGERGGLAGVRRGRCCHSLHRCDVGGDGIRGRRRGRLRRDHHGRGRRGCDTLRCGSNPFGGGVERSVWDMVVRGREEARRRDERAEPHE